MTTLLISAGDASGDLHAAGFVRAFLERDPSARFVGLGGSHMEEAGVELCARQDALAVGGLVELTGSVGRIMTCWRALSRALAREEPDLVVLVDSGGFNLRFARRVRRKSRVPILYYIAPQVWAWRAGRLRALERYVDQLAVIFPFEPRFYRQTDLPVEFVGHPLLDDLPAASDSRDRDLARSDLGLEGDRSLVAILPGSRRNEVERLLPLQLEAARRLVDLAPDVGFLLGVAPSIATNRVHEILRASGLAESVDLSVFVNRTHDVIRACDVAMAKPGTITVELSLLNRPMVVVGKVSALTAAVVRRRVKLDWFAMPNLILEQACVPEFLQENALPSSIAEAVAQLLEGPARSRQLEGLARVRSKLEKDGAARRVAELAEALIEHSTP